MLTWFVFVSLLVYHSWQCYLIKNVKKKVNVYQSLAVMGDVIMHANFQMMDLGSADV
jgi:hypothetical protein